MMPVPLLACLVLSACGADANLVIELKRLPSEDPFDGVGVMRIIVERTQTGNVVLDQTWVGTEPRMEVSTVPLGSVIHVTVEGYQDGTLTNLLSSGVTDWIHVAEGDTVQIQVCFCRQSTVEAGGCDCTDGSG